MSLEGLKVDSTLDQRGLLCPMPIVNTAKAISKISSGQILEVKCTDPGSKPDFAAWARATGNALLTVKEENATPKVYTFYIRKR